jgi:methyl-accepting chemotaxis protein
MDQATQQNAALVEEMAAAASSMKTQAQELVDTVAVFRLDHHSSAQAPRAQPQQTTMAHTAAAVHSLPPRGARPRALAAS